MSLVKQGGHPYIVRQSTANGKKGNIEESTLFLNPGNTISFGQDTATIFYQEEAYFTGDKIKILKSKYTEFGKRNAQFFLSSMRKAFSSFAWGSSRFNVETLKKQLITLPVTADGKIDFDFMESFVAELEEERLAELVAYLDHYELSDADQNDAIKDLDAFLNEKMRTVEWGEFKMETLFGKIKVNALKYKTKELPKHITSEYTLPALTAGIDNQGLNNYVSRTGATIMKNVISVSANGANTGATFYQNKEFTILQDAYAIKWIFDDTALSDNQYLFLTCSISKTIYGNYEWTNKAVWERIKTKSISLPVSHDGKIDFAFMEMLVSAVQKLVIKDVVIYAERKIEETKEILTRKSEK